MPNQYTKGWNEKDCAICSQPRVSGTLFCGLHLAKVVDALKKPHRGVYVNDRHRWRGHNRRRRADGRL